MRFKALINRLLNVVNEHNIFKLNFHELDRQPSKGTDIYSNGILCVGDHFIILYKTISPRQDMMCNRKLKFL